MRPVGFVRSTATYEEKLGDKANHRDIRYIPVTSFQAHSPKNISIVPLHKGGVDGLNRPQSGLS
jgi:hypothetical protein